MAGTAGKLHRGNRHMAYYLKSVSGTRLICNESRISSRYHVLLQLLSAAPLDSFMFLYLREHGPNILVIDLSQDFLARTVDAKY